MAPSLLLNNSFLCHLFKARVALYEGGIRKIELIFNASGANPEDWFSVDRLITSPWSDIKTEEKNFFSLSGDCQDLECRSFLINRRYGGCGVDAGWLVTGSTHCDWEKARGGRIILYSNISTYTEWSSSGEVLSQNKANKKY